MAGGEGRRLRPLTETMPKPLVPVGGIPAITHILRLLRKTGVTEASVTVGYLADMIEKYCGAESEGISLKYCYESSPLGTAGSVLAAAKDFSDDFIVISGDAISEAALDEAMTFHKCSKALATLILSRVDDPLEYGVVICGSGGKITKFIEKPSLSQAYADTVNTGIYILSPEILRYIPSGEFYDFGKDLFPKLLSTGRLFGIPDRGYWCDIGDLEAYYNANMYFSSGDSVIGKNCTADKSAVVESSVLMDNVVLGIGCRVEKSVLASGVSVGDNAVIGEGCVIGSGCNIGAGASLAPGSRLPAFTRIPDGYLLGSNSVLRGISDAEKAFFGDGLRFETGCCGVWFCRNVGAAISAACGGRIGVMYADGRNEPKISTALLEGIRDSGGNAVSLGSGFEAACAYAPPCLRLALSVFIREHDGTVDFFFFDADGLYPHRSFERALTSALLSPFPENAGNIGRSEITSINFIESCYYPALLSFIRNLNGTRLKAIRDNSPSLILARAFSALGANETEGPEFRLSDDGRSLTVSQNGISADTAHLIASLLSFDTRSYSSTIALSHSVPEAVKNLLGNKGVYYSHCPHDRSEDDARRLAKLHPEFTDAVFLALRIASLIAEGHSLPELCGLSPSFAFIEEEYGFPGIGKKISVIGKIGKPSGDGVYIRYENGGVRVIPGIRGFMLKAESAEGEYASEILDISKKRISELIRNGSK